MRGNTGHRHRIQIYVAYYNWCETYFFVGGTPSHAPTPTPVLFFLCDVIRFRFLPLEDLYKKRYAMDGPAVPAVPDDCAGSVRIRGLKAFAAAVSGEPVSQAVPSDLQYHDGDGLMLLAGSHRESRSEYSEASTGSGSHHMPRDSGSGRLFEFALRPSGPSSQHSGRAPPGMGGGGGGVLVGPGGERTTRSFSGPGPSGYFGSGGSLRAGSEGDGWRASKGTGPGGMHK